MYKTGDLLKANPAVVEQDYSPWKNTQVYDNMLKAAEKIRFEVVGETTMDYILKRNTDGEQFNVSKNDVYSKFVPAN